MEMMAADWPITDPPTSRTAIMSKTTATVTRVLR
jgi:hypothetical protein